MWSRLKRGIFSLLVVSLLCGASWTEGELHNARAKQKQQRHSEGGLPAQRKNGYRNALAVPQEKEQEHDSRRLPPLPRHGQLRAFGISHRHDQGLHRNLLKSAGVTGQGQARDGIDTGPAQKQGLAGNFTEEQLADANALRAFKKANWAPGSVLEGWVMRPVASNGTAPPPWCFWYGVTCSNGTYRAIGIEVASKIQSSNCAQSIPPELGNMTALRTIDLSYNNLCGTLPSTLKRWAAVTRIQLGGNILEGPLSQALGEWPALEILDLSFNNFTGNLPDRVGNWTRLKLLRMKSAFKSGGPSSLLPSTLGRLTGLIALDVSYNFFSGPLPSTLGQLTGLSTLVLHRNNFSGPLSNTISELTGLSELDLSYNSFSGPLPSALRQLTGLSALDLSNNGFMGLLPSTLGRSARLLSLALSFNNFSGPLPSTLGQLTGLNQLKLNHNRFTGPLPSTLGQLTGLMSLVLSYNCFSGPLPSTLGQFRGLMSLALSFNNFSGPLPSTVGQLTGLNQLNLHHNSFSGPLPSTLGQLIGLTSLTLSFNSFSGPLPSTLGRLAGLTALDLSCNSFSGPLPSVLSQLTGLVELDLSGNSFGGPLPSKLDQLFGLNALNLSYNSFSGPLPFTLSQLILLSSIDLSSNAFLLSAGQGGPRTNSFEALCQMTGLVSLGLSGNSYRGPVPACLGGLGGLTALGLARLNLSGELHTLTQLNALTRLSSLDLSGSNLGGTFPEAIGHMPSLADLDLSSNPISGIIPDVFGQLRSLSRLTLANTHMTGSLPSSLGLLRLETLQVPDTFPCPEVTTELKCNNVNLNVGGLFCHQCASYCSTCPPPPQSEAVQAVLKYEGVSSIPNIDGVQLSSNGSVESLGLTLGFTSTAAAPGVSPGLAMPYGPLAFDLLAPLNQTLRSIALISTADGYPWDILPKSIALFTCLVELRLQNLLSGDIPDSVSALKHLTLLDLSNQGLSGSLSVVERLSLLRILNLGNNKLSGSLPTAFSFPTNLASLDLSANQFEGPFPQSLTALTGLTVLDVHQNMLGGDLPPGLAALPLVYFAYDPLLLNCPDLTVRPPRQVNPSSAFCQLACPNYCNKYAPPLRPPPPLLCPPPPNPPPDPPPVQAVLQPWATGVIAAAAALVVVTAVAVVLLLRKSWRDSVDDVEKRSMCRFTFKELEEATRKFSNPIGGCSDGEGTQAFLGSFASGKQVVVKCQKGLRKKSAHEQAEAFRRQIKLLSSAHHRHLIALLGYCLHKGRLYLVEELAQRGSLSSILRSDPASLTWEHRLAIALGAAQGLDYLHSQIHPPILHGHIQSSTTFITDTLEAKLGSLGTASMEGQEHSIQDLSPTGYLDPERLATCEVTAASDVYSLGVVLAELATGWQAVENGTHILDRVIKATSKGSTQRVIAETLQPELQRGTEDSTTEIALDEEGPRKEGQLTLQGFAAFVALAMRCCSVEPSRRPTVHHVAQQLEEMLEGFTGRVAMPSLAGKGEGTMPFPWYRESRIINTVEDMFGSITFPSLEGGAGSSSSAGKRSGLG